MSFNINYFSKLGNPGTSGGNTVWYYFDQPADNVASIVSAPLGAVNTTFFSLAYSTYGIRAKAGDVILIASRSSSTLGVNSATPCLAMVPNDWDSNGASIIGGIRNSM
jgi:hypothetical protein